jgi:hypothetical protein
MSIAHTATEFCTGTGCMEKCRTCHHVAVWDELNELPDVERKLHQSGMKSLNTSRCQITSGCFYKPKNIKQK